MVRIDESKCAGCGICQQVCPSGFEMVAGKSRLKDEKADCIKQAAASCPMGAIYLDDNETPVSPAQNPSEPGRGMGRGRGRGLGRGQGMGRGRRFGRHFND